MWFRALPLFAALLLLPAGARAAKPYCGDGIQHGKEQCDGTDLNGASCQSLGYSGGALGCTSSCTYDTSGCETYVCGDGVAQGSESCDGTDLAGATCQSLGYTSGTLGCTGSCTYDTSGCYNQVCGDGIAQGSESCDGTDLAGATCQSLGFDGGTLGCSSSCTYDTSGCYNAVCGDGLAQGSESCDGTDLAGATCQSLGYDAGTLACTGSCTYDASGCYDYVCGDGVAQGTESCDGTDLAGATCQSLGFDQGTLGCTGSCTYDTSGCSNYVCGDGVAQGSESCDGTDLAGATCQSLGYTGGTLACSGSCAYDTSGCYNQVCGDGVIQGSETCDGTDLAGATCQSLGFDGGTLACSGSCAYDTSGCYTTVCGDGLAQGSESCDGLDLNGASCQSLGYDQGTLGCNTDCTYDTSGCSNFVCGDGVAQGTESCDGSDLSGATCQTLGFDSGTLGCTSACTYDTSACTTTSVCGNGVIEGTESCDGTDLAGASCMTLGYDGGTLGCTGSCTYDTSACTVTNPYCGDGLVDGDHEECDYPSDSACPGQCSTDCACPATTATGTLRIDAVDVGQGDGLVVVSPDGFVMVLDAGKPGQGPTMLSHLQSLGLGSVDYTLVSHMHSDHLGGMDTVIQAHPEVVDSFDNGVVYPTTEYSDYAAAAGTRRVTLHIGDHVDLGPSMSATVLHAAMGSSNENNNSIVLKLVYGGESVLLGGDCEAECEGTFDPGPIQIYKVHHHGSSTSSTDALLSEMNASVGIISVGANNPYGHPAASTLQALADHNVTVWRTDLDGNVDVLATQSSYTVNGVGQCTDGETRTCGSDVGACMSGTETCSGGSWGSCIGAIGPTPEDCSNGIDDDCDGLVDAADPDCSPNDYPRFSQVYYDTVGTDSVEEYFELYNPEVVPVDLSGWTVSDNQSTWDFPYGTTIPAGSKLIVARDATGFQNLFGFAPDIDGLTLALGNSGDELALDDDTGAEIDFVAWENYVAGWSITATTGNAIIRTDPNVDTDTVNDWSVQSPAQP